MIDDRSNKNLVRRVAWFLGGFSLLTMTIAMMSFTRSSDKDTFGAAWSSKAQPFSTVNPASLNVITVDRPFRSDIQHSQPFDKTLIELFWFLFSLYLK